MIDYSIERKQRHERMRVLFKMIWGYPLATKEYKIAKAIDKDLAERIIKEQKLHKYLFGKSTKVVK